MCVQLGSFAGLKYEDAIPCSYTFLYDDPPVDTYYPTFFEEYEVGVWAGIMFGFGAVVVVLLMLCKVANRDARIMYKVSELFIRMPKARNVGKAADAATSLR